MSIVANEMTEETHYCVNYYTARKLNIGDVYVENKLAVGVRMKDPARLGSCDWADVSSYAFSSNPISQVF